MKKLYFLDKSEKERILHLHESRTQNQYLLTEAIDRTSFVNEVDGICQEGTYGTGTFTDAQVQKSAELMKRNLPNRPGYYSNDSLQIIADNIRTFKSIGNYCRIAKKYKEIGGVTNNTKDSGSGTLTSWLTKYVYDDNAWTLYIKQPLQELIKASTKPKNDTEISTVIETGKKTITTYCSTVQGGTVNEAAYEVFKFATQGRGYMSDSTWKNVLSKIKTLSINDFCAIYKKYEQEIGKNMIDKFLSYILSPTAKQEIITLISSMAKGSPQADKTGTGGVTPGGGGGGAYQVAGGYVFNSAMTPQALQAIRAKIGSTDTAKTLTQNDINLIYQKLG